MKKLLITLSLIILSGCGITNKIEPISEIGKFTQNDFVKQQIVNLQQKVENNEITQEYAQQELKKIIEENKKLNDGSTESILKKFKNIDPKIADALEKKIRKLHPEEFEK